MRDIKIRKGLKKVLPGSATSTIEILNSLPDIYLVAIWAHYGYRDYKLAGWRYDPVSKIMLPLVYYYVDHNGEMDEYHLTTINMVTSGTLITWTRSKKVAEAMVAAFNNNEDIPNNIFFKIDNLKF